MKRAFLTGAIMILAAIGLNMGAKTMAKAQEVPQEQSALWVAPDFQQILAKWRRVEMPFDSARLSPPACPPVGQLVEASPYPDPISWRPTDPALLGSY